MNWHLVFILIGVIKMKITIGNILKQTRQSQGLTQKAVADGICSQAMLSSLEQLSVEHLECIYYALEMKA